MTLAPEHRLPPSPPGQVPIAHLDELWFQVTGTLCNLTCRHCFISCSPRNDAFGFLSFEDVRRRLDESVALGVREYYFTGGEPFLHPDMVAILCETLRYGPATVLTNGTVLKDAWLDTLASAEAASPYSLEFRVSLDGFSAQTNDPIRGDGTFDRAIAGVARLAARGLVPIITAARTWPLSEEPAVVAAFVSVLRRAGYARPRIKVLPTLHLGAESQRSHGYAIDERVSQAMMEGFDASQLLCEHSRTITDRGVHVCPILIESPDSRLAGGLAASLVPFHLRHGACFTCYRHGAICSNHPAGESIAP